MKPNINNKGRVMRAAIAAILLLTGACLVTHALMVGMVLIAAGLFCAFEAWRGWCAARACGIKTPL